MPGRPSDSLKPSAAVVPYSPEVPNAAVYPLRHNLSFPISRMAISWSRGNIIRVTLLKEPEKEGSKGDIGGKVMEMKLGGHIEGEVGDAQWRKIAYGSVSPFAMLQSRKNSMEAPGKMSSPHHAEWWEFVMEYSKDINSVFGSTKLNSDLVIEDPKTVLKKSEEPTCLKAAWELIKLFYVDKLSQAWLPERLVDWLADYDSLFSVTQTTIYSRLVEFQNELVNLQFVEDNIRYWEAISSALAVGWLDIVVKLLRLHGSYQLDQLGNRETENGLVEAVAVLISKMPRLRPVIKDGRLGECYKSKPDFRKAWERWRGQITKLDCSAFWVQCGHQQTRDGLRNMLQIMLGNANALSATTYNWIELFIASILYVQPLTMGIESMYSLAQKCMLSKPTSNHSLMSLMIGILGETTEVVLAECSRSFGPWMVSHAMEMLISGSEEADNLLCEERHNLGGISIEELHRLVYAQVLSSHASTWQIAPIYLMSCMKQGMGLLEMLLTRQPVQHNRTLLKIIEICRLYELVDISSSIMKIAGVHHWKHGRKGSGVFWLQQARDEVRLNRIAQQLFDFVGKSVSGESLKQWEGLIELLDFESKIAGGLQFLHKYKDYKKFLQQIHGEKAADAARKAVESLISLMRNPSTPQRFWLPVLYDSLELLNWQEHPLLKVSETNLLLNKLQELSMAKLRGDFVEPNLPPEALSSIRLALAINLGRAILEE